MTQIFDEKGIVFPVTVIETEPVTITQIKTLEKDGYDAVQVGFGSRAEKNINKAQQGHSKDLGNFETFSEIRITEEEAGEVKVGDKIDLSAFEEGQSVGTIATSKGKGFQGVVKRYNFKGGPRTHGQKHTERSVGSIGAQGVARVFKGQRMPGRMGSDQVSMREVQIVKINTETNELYLKGAIPGRRGSLIEIKA